MHTSGKGISPYSGAYTSYHTVVFFCVDDGVLLSDGDWFIVC